jgi:hypothetical protein
MPTQGLQGSPHSTPAQGSLPPQPGQPLEQRPFTHSVCGHDVVPSGHIWHGARIAGQSASLMHIEVQLGYDETQIPIWHSTDGHCVVPSGQIWHGASICAQSIAVSHSLLQTGNAGLQTPFSLQYEAVAMSHGIPGAAMPAPPVAGSPGPAFPHVLHSAPQGLPAQGFAVPPPVELDPPRPPVIEPETPPPFVPPPLVPPEPPPSSAVSSSSPSDEVPLHAPTNKKTPASAGRCQIFMVVLYPFEPGTAPATNKKAIPGRGSA